ncbi:hypothetical protein H6F96_10230 [Microcoleus sp. FACHB-53]|nr:hypothetical protein [Microcoleus sp. FACHB-53]
MTKIYLNLGIDFGTSFTKVCVRDTDRDRSWVVTFSNGKPALTQALLPTKLGISSEGKILAGLTPLEWSKHLEGSYTSIDFIKMRLANLYIHQELEGWQFEYLSALKISGLDLEDPDTIENLCAYYLSSVISKAKAWVLDNNADLVKNQQIEWSANIGVPVKYCDSKAIDGFGKVLSLAWLLSESHPESTTVNELKQQLKLLRLEIRDRDDIPCYAIAEVAAAIHSYTASRQATEGVYVFFDVGSGTLEGASFRFWRKDEMPRVDFYSGEVEPLGVNALTKCVANGSQEEEIEIEDCITRDCESLCQAIESLSTRLAKINPIRSGEYIANKLKLSNEATENALKQTQLSQERRLLHLILGQRLIHRQVAKVVMITKEKNPNYYSESSTLPIFIAGGGGIVKFYRDTIESTYLAFGHQYAGVPAYAVKELPPPLGDFSLSGIQPSHFHRFAVAYGLSIPEAEAPEVQLPRLFPILLKQEVRAYSHVRPGEGRQAIDSEYFECELVG